ncbi:UDP-N-acetylenolpyruvoylglucosamine reductase [bioreactor metagenome]|jgi:UDP-N-acetylmuramate dehydrogenase|uniref:UDP-N-acetylenolpyruvoylglucosamine reductase n=2 Tax=root TaxID=1 RepID=A0A652ZXI3_9SPIR|nr:UDP-N-acetylmuramate dehydrogenase [Treponema sp.]VBB40496.1 putative UDP-N-acetylenolpyruvoylglucosamine reductase [uncultured Spirochaetota bacterium]HOI22786.1 UDP-N-acetylmuramate dehydrogenase [Spirochaetales bacterium]
MEKLWQIARKINIDPARIRISEPMSLHTSFKIGGPADYYLRLSSESELAALVKTLRDAGEPFFVLGGGANLLVGDKGIRGWVLDLSKLSDCRLESPFSVKEGGRCEGEVSLYAQAGISIDRLCEEALALGLQGIENFYGMPGSLGGAVYMNARCYEDDIATILGILKIISPAGEAKNLDSSTLPWSYKRSAFQPGAIYDGWIVTAAELKLRCGEAPRIASVMRDRKMDRVSKGHYRYPSAGSMFKNNRSFGKPTGAILDSLAFKGRRLGDAAVSPWHANIFVNMGRASAKDMRRLIESAQEAALRTYGFSLEPEVLFVGEF